MEAIKPTSGALENLTEEQVTFVTEKAHEIWSIYDDGIKSMVTHFDNQNFDNDELIAVWTLLNSKIRTAYKIYKENSKPGETIF